MYVQLKGKIIHLQTLGKHKSERLVAILRDHTEKQNWFGSRVSNQVIEKLKINDEYIVFGKPAPFNNKFNFPHPEIEPVSSEKIDLGEQLQPYYSSTEKLKAKGLDSKGISKIMRNLLVQVKGFNPETLSVPVLERLRFTPREEALFAVHFPPDQEKLDKARLRLKFEELFLHSIKPVKTEVFSVQKKLKDILFPW